MRLRNLLACAGLASLALAAAPAALVLTASPAAARTCSQSIVDPSHRPNFVGGYNIVIRTDSCGRWMRARVYCADLHKWLPSQHAVRAIGDRSTTGSAGCGPSRWGFQYWYNPPGGQSKWIWKQEGTNVSTRAVTTAYVTHRIARNSVSYTDPRRCRYKWYTPSVGQNGFTAHGSIDSYHHAWWAVARCNNGRLIYGPVRYSGWPAVSQTRGGCGFTPPVSGLEWWGVRAVVFKNLHTQEHRLFCLDINSNCRDQALIRESAQRN
jgi:hypothetical protein